ncbi:MAG: glycosyltransferase [Alphaproteobacteria bacterium]|nr:glycosyltransferase [Alphaproteobacteria bacterium]
MSGPARQVVVFARAPRLGVGKRRLAADIGRLGAHRFYRANLARTLRRLVVGPWQLSVAVAHPKDAGAAFFAGHDVLLQPPGDLGKRMTAVLRSLAPGPAIIVGSDIPDIRVEDIQAAFQVLGRRDAVFGPASDGGYWLAGMARRRPVPRGFMADVRWSGPHALVDTIASLPAGYSHGLIGEKDDIDTGEDYWRYRKRGRS